MSCIISYLAFDKCGSSMKRKVHWDDEENGESEMDPFEEARQMFLTMSRATTRNRELKMF